MLLLEKIMKEMNYFCNLLINISFSKLNWTCYKSNLILVQTVQGLLIKLYCNNLNTEKKITCTVLAH